MNVEEAKKIAEAIAVALVKRPQNVARAEVAKPTQDTPLSVAFVTISSGPPTTVTCAGFATSARATFCGSLFFVLIFVSFGMFFYLSFFLVVFPVRHVSKCRAHPDNFLCAIAGT